MSEVLFAAMLGVLSALAYFGGMTLVLLNTGTMVCG